MINILTKNRIIFKLTIFLLLFYTHDIYSQCPTLKKVSVGECTNNGSGPQVLVAWTFNFDNSNDYSIVIDDGNGNTISKSIGPSYAGTPYYLQEIVPSNGNTYSSTITISGCGTTVKSYTLPPACNLNPTCGGSGTLGGVVFKDYDNNGIQGASESGFVGILVKLYNDSHTLVGTATTDLNGKWYYGGLTDGQNIRIEYDKPSLDATGYKVGKAAGDVHSTIQFGTVPSCNNNLGLYKESEYIDANPRVATVRFMNANNLSPDPCSGAEQYVVVAYDYNSNGQIYGAEGYDVPVDKGIAKAKDVGLVWGVAWNKYTSHVYSAAALRRYSSLGPNGLGAIYASKQVAPGGAWATSLLVDVTTLGIDIGQNDMNWSARGLPDCKNQPSMDPEAFPLVGKIGFGDIDISEDGQWLYGVNLKNRTLLKMHLNGTGTAVTSITEIAIPNPCANPIDWRPWALTYYKGKVYVGGVNAGYSSPTDYPADDFHRLKGYVYEFDPATGTFSAPILEQPLDYPHPGDAQSRWLCWQDDFMKQVVNGWPNNFNQPLLSDIEFDAYGNMVIAYMDRGSIQWGWMNYYPDGTFYSNYFADGDVSRAYKNETGIFLTEDNAKIGYDTGCGSGGNGPGGGEFYCGDSYYHPECAQGSLASHPSNNELFLSYMDPYNICSGGTGILSHANGTRLRGIELYNNVGCSNNGWFGKAGGIGDMEMLVSPIETFKQIGNRVWLDLDNDGIQDPGEPPMEGIYVGLYDTGGNLVESTTTNSYGEYYFENYVPNTNYYIIVGANGQFDPVAKRLNTFYKITKVDIGMADIPDLNDSDGKLKLNGFLKNYPYIYVTTPATGIVNHSYDFGFYSSVLCEIGNYVWEDKNANGKQDDGNTGINGIVVTMTDQDGTVYTTTTANDPVTGNPGYYIFQNLEPGDYTICFDKGAYSITTKDSGTDDSIDSDADPVTGCTQTTTLSNGEKDMTWDAGLYKPASLGDYVWVDKNDNGCQDLGEVPIANVIVKLYTDNNTDGVPDGAAINTTQTDANGFYQFTNLAPGNYIVGFTKPGGYKPSIENSGSCGDDKDSDADLTTGNTGTINLESGEHDPTIDAGFKPSFDLALIKHKPLLPAKMGQPLTFNIEVFNQSEAGTDVQGVQIVDYINLAGYDFVLGLNPGWTLVGNKAYYTYSGTIPAQSSVTIPITLTVKYGATESSLKNESEIVSFKDMDGVVQTEDKDSYPDDNADNDNDVSCGSLDDDNISGNVRENPGDDEDDNDVACVDIFDLAMKKVETSTGPYKYGDNVTFTYTVYNQGNIPAYNISVTDYLPEGFNYVGSANPTWTQSVTTTPSTTIAGPLAAGQSTTVTLVLKLKSATDLTNGWTNRAEISKAENSTGTDLSNYDYDSKLDIIPTNDAGGNPDSPSDDSIDGNGTGTPGDSNPATDEDDADPARVKVYDLALTKKLITTAPYSYYQDLAFEIEVFNQGNEAVKNVVINDYIPAGYTFNAALNSGWSGVAPTISYTIAGPINPGASVKIPVVLKIVQNNGSLTAWDNYAEIKSMQDVNGIDVSTKDADSNPNSDSAHERAVKPGDTDDNNINGHYIPDGTDEDDHDPAGIKIFDLALKKVETSAGPYTYGDQVTFTYTVYNQGNVPANNIEVTDYLPSGFKYVPALNPTWTNVVTSTPKTTIVPTLAPGASTTVNLILVAQPTTDIVDGWTNKAEITKAKDPLGNNATDFDSNLDSDPTNDIGGTPDTPQDNLVTDDGKDGDGDGITDEDDADPAKVKIYDLALRKKLLTGGPYTYYQNLTFEITVFNQGNQVLKDIEVKDYIPTGYKFVSANNPNWAGVSPTVNRTITGPLNPGDSTKVQIILQLVQTTGGVTDWDNYAEVASMNDENGVDVSNKDADSYPNSNTPIEKSVRPGDANDDNINGHYIMDGTDEDDHDPAGIKVFDLALTKTTNAIPPMNYDQIVDFTLTVYNQGNESSHNIVVTDYVPAGFIYLPHLNPTWTQSLTTSPTTTIAGPLAPGAQTTVTIKLQLQYSGVAGAYINKAEITSSLDKNNQPFVDIDSKPDNNPNNDIGGTPNTPQDDNVSDDGKDGDGDGITDEDDEDPWTVPVASIGNYVWYDNNDNGTQDDGLPSTVGVKDVTVILYDCNGKEVLRILTDANGHYEFKNLIPGNYNVKFNNLPLKTIWAKQNIGNDALDSDPDAGGVAICTNLAPGEDDPTWDAGILKLSSLGDYVWLDIDGDGKQDPNEDGIPGVVVRLLDQDGNLISSTTTDNLGYYLFDNLRPGTYIVQFVTPSGLTTTTPDLGGDDTKDSDANPNNSGKTDPVTLVAGENNMTLDAGYKCTLGVIVTQPQTICEGTTVTLTATPTAGEPIYKYLWSTGETTQSIDVTPIVTTNYSVTVTDKYGCEAIGTTSLTVQPKAKIGDYVWLDVNHNGKQDFFNGDPDLNETGINGVTVNLYSASDPNTILMTQVTHTNVDTTGYYEFNVCSGDYFVEFVTPTGHGYKFTLQDNTNDVFDSDADVVTGRTISTHLDPGEIDHTWDAGYYQTASIGDYVWHDIDADGIQDAGEPGVDGVTVVLHDGNGNVVGTTVTANGGHYEFTGLIPGDYYVCFDITGSGYSQISLSNQGYDDTKDSDANANGCTEITNIIANENDVTWDLGVYNLAGLGDYVWLDKDADGYQDANETGISGVVVHLYEDSDANGIPDGAQISQTTTNGVGYYQFTNLIAGTYLVKFDKPVGYSVSPKNSLVGGVNDDAKDSDGDAIFGYSDPIVLGDNQFDPKIDQGYYQTAKIGDYVWYDTNGNGIQDPNETGVSGVTVTLYVDTDGDGVPETPVRTVVTSTGTDAGKYLFDNVLPGTYKICFDLNGTTYDGFTMANQGANDAVDSDAGQSGGCTDPFTVVSGTNDMTYDAGVVKLAKLGDYVWLDNNANGYQDATELPISGVKVELYDNNNNLLKTTYTDGNGYYLFDQLYPGSYVAHFVKPIGYTSTIANNPTSDSKDSDANPVTGNSPVYTLVAGEANMTVDAGYYLPAKIGDYVWEDKDADGIQDPNENGINGIVVTLYDGSGNPISNTTTGTDPVTGKDGYYIFDNLTPGTYYVCFDKGTYDNISTKNAGTNTGLDSDADPMSGCTVLTVLESGETDRSWDAGLYNLASLGDYVWYDQNANGNQEITEAGINGIVVKLYSDNNKDGNPDGGVLATKTTVTNAGKDGYYIFDNLQPGSYLVQFDPSPSYTRTESNVGSDDTKDSDANTMTGMSQTVTLVSGQHDPTIDAGYYYAARLGDYTWLDNNGNGLQDPTEKCIDSVKIILYKVIDIPTYPYLDTIEVKSTWSHSVLDGIDTVKCGFYEFTQLAPGNYLVQFINPDPDVYSQSPKEVLFNKAVDSNPGNNGYSSIVTLAPGENNPTIDAGYYKGMCLEGVLWEDIYVDLRSKANVYDSLDLPMPGIKVDLYLDPNEFVTGDEVLVKTDYTDNIGEYLFTNVPIGQYFIVLNLPSDKTVVNNDFGGDDNLDSDFYIDEETGQVRSTTFSIAAFSGVCKTDISGGTTDKIVLPLSMLIYEVSWNESSKVVDINWETTNEREVDHYILMRRAEVQSNYETIGEIAAKGGLQQNSYLVVDPNVEKGLRYYYRLIPVDLDGRKANKYEESLLIPGDKLKVIAYPNPTSSELNVEIFGKENKNMRLDLMDNVGRKMIKEVLVEKNQNNHEKVNVDVSGLPQGAYYLRVTSGQDTEMIKVTVIR